MTYTPLWAGADAPTFGADDGPYWRGLKPPAAPSGFDSYTFMQYLKGDRILLLGSTRNLLSLATEAWDVNPLYEDDKIEKRNWLSLDTRFDTIIGDGVLNFEKGFSDQLVKLASQNCSRLFVRTFLNPSWPTKYAKYFPTPDDFEIKPWVVPNDKVYCFYGWDFHV